VGKIKSKIALVWNGLKSRWYWPVTFVGVVLVGLLPPWVVAVELWTSWHFYVRSVIFLGAAGLTMLPLRQEKKDLQKGWTKKEEELTNDVKRALEGVEDALTNSHLEQGVALRATLGPLLRDLVEYTNTSVTEVSGPSTYEGSL
jgi:hypothetical protein